MYGPFFFCQLTTTFTPSMSSMRIWLWIVGLGIALSGCRSKGNITVHGQPVTDQKTIKEIAGTWYATAETLALLDKKKYTRDAVYIFLSPDSAFKARLPDCLDAAAKGGLIWDAIGSWRLFKDERAWKLGMSFEKGRLFRYSTFTHLDIVVKDSILTLVRHMGNLNKEEMLEFRKQP